MTWKQAESWGQWMDHSAFPFCLSQSIPFARFLLPSKTFKNWTSRRQRREWNSNSSRFFMQISLERCQVYTHICCSVAFTICSQQSVRFMALHDITFKVSHTRSHARANDCKRIFCHQIKISQVRYILSLLRRLVVDSENEKKFIATSCGFGRKMRTGNRSEWETLNAHAKVLTSLSSEAATARLAHELSKIEAQGCQKTIKNSLNGLNAISCVPHSLPRLAYFGVKWLTADVLLLCVEIILSPRCWWSFVSAMQRGVWAMNFHSAFLFYFANWINIHHRTHLPCQ